MKIMPKYVDSNTTVTDFDIKIFFKVNVVFIDYGITNVLKKIKLILQSLIIVILLFMQSLCIILFFNYFNNFKKKIPKLEKE